MDRDVTIYVIDDDAFDMRFVVAVLREQCYQVESFSTGEEFLNHETGTKIGCVITDQRLPGIQGNEIQEQLLQRNSNLALIMISGMADVPITVQMMKHGAVTILQKPLNPDLLLIAVREGLAQSRMRQSQRDRFEDAQHLLTLLTDDETQILRHLAKGLSHKAISAQMSISLRTVDRRQQTLLHKMRSPNIRALLANVDLQGSP